MEADKKNINLGLSTDKILSSAAAMVSKIHTTYPAKYLDVGAGHGDLIKLIRSQHQVEATGCDYTDELIHLKDIKFNVVDLNVEKLPYENGEFDLITCTEVLEHVEHYRETLREIYRVLKVEGTFVLTTPNILNLFSRVRFVFSGFYNLFGPLHFHESALYSAGGHINPIGLFFLAHSLVDAGFKDIHVGIDKRQRTSMFWMLFLYVPIKIAFYFFKRREISRYKSIDQHNERFVDLTNTLDLLLGRTLVIGCKK